MHQNPRREARAALSTFGQSHIIHWGFLGGELIHSAGFMFWKASMLISQVQHYDLIVESGRTKEEMEEAVTRKRIDLKGLLHKLLEIDESSH